MITVKFTKNKGIKKHPPLVAFRLAYAQNELTEQIVLPEQIGQWQRTGLNWTRAKLTRRCFASVYLLN